MFIAVYCTVYCGRHNVHADSMEHAIYYTTASNHVIYNNNPLLQVIFFNICFKRKHEIALHANKRDLLGGTLDLKT